MSYLGFCNTSLRIGFICDKIFICIPPHIPRHGIHTRITTKLVYNVFCFFITRNISCWLYSFKEPKISIQLPIIFLELNNF